jgi:hypothetical protein
LGLPGGILIHVLPSLVASLALAFAAVLLNRRGLPAVPSTAVVGAAFGAIWGAAWAISPGEANYVLNLVPALVGSETYSLVSGLYHPLATDDSIDPTPWLFRLPQIEVLVSTACWALVGAAAGRLVDRRRTRGPDARP